MGTRALINGKEEQALRYFLRAGKSGLPIASSVVAFFCEFRLGVDGDDDTEDDERNLTVGAAHHQQQQQPTSQASYETAERLYTLAALQDCGLAMARLAFLKTHGRNGIRIQHAEADKHRRGCAAKGESAVAWLRVTAEAGCAASQFCLALCYYNGIATPEDDRQAYVWCERAAVQGLAGAMNVLGNLHIEGSGCPQDPASGLRWYIRAAELREPAAIYNIGTLFERGIAVEEDAVQAFGWYERAARFGSINAMNTLGIFYEQGTGMNAYNPLLAVKSYLAAASRGHPHAQYNLGRCYHEGFGVPRSDLRAADWFGHAAKQNHQLSQLSLAICIEHQLGNAEEGVYAFSLDEAESAREARRAYAAAARSGCADSVKRLLPQTACTLLPAARAILQPPSRRSTALIHTLPRELLDVILALVQPRHATLPGIHLRAVLAVATSTASLFSHHLASREAFLQCLGLADLEIGHLPLPTCDCVTRATLEVSSPPTRCTCIKHVVDGMEKVEVAAPIVVDWDLVVVNPADDDVTCCLIAPAAEADQEFSNGSSSSSTTQTLQKTRFPVEVVWWKDATMEQAYDKSRDQVS
ncbi:hypothetical protein HKX48_002115 [Thoreauomyces humboldtii]|nr:hypothetical protein HKX48_002115 [Thoreauomyces humboldtii]